MGRHPGENASVDDVICDADGWSYSGVLRTEHASALGKEVSPVWDAEQPGCQVLQEVRGSLSRRTAYVINRIGSTEIIRCSFGMIRYS